MTDDHVVAARDGAWLTVAIVGRVTKPVVDDFADVLRDAVDDGKPYVVLFDRSSMTAPTADGRTALATWEDDLMPAVARTVTGWADVYDARRAATLHAQGHDSTDSAYPHRIFDDVDRARSWLAGLLQSAPTTAGDTARP
jgi:hypothetical protein